MELDASEQGLNFYLNEHETKMEAWQRFERMRQSLAHPNAPFVSMIAESMRRLAETEQEDR